MTCRERLANVKPENIDPNCDGGCVGCPSDYDYLDDPDWCVCNNDNCHKCWDREIPGSDVGSIKDSGTRRQFDTGAVRDIQEGKGRCDLLPLDVIDVMADCWDTWHKEIFLAIHTFQLTGDTVHLGYVLTHFGFHHYSDPQTAILEVAKHFEAGCAKYGENNWQKGIPTHCYIDSAVRHYLKWLRGDKDEPHDRAFCWNILCCIWTCIHKPELNDYGKKVEQE